MSSVRQREGLGVARLLMVLSSISPLFILWGIRGNKLIPDHLLLIVCALMVLVPNGFLWLRIHIARKHKDRKELTVGSAEDHRDHLLVYLFTMLLPLYPIDMSSWRDLAAIVAALSFVIFLFWHLNLHYMNLLFAVFGYRVYTICPPMNTSSISSRASYALITRQTTVAPGDRLIAYRLSDTVYFEVQE